MLVRLIAVCAAVLALATIGSTSVSQARAPSSSAAAVEKNYLKYFNAGNYPAALMEAQKLVPMIRAQHGERSFNYVVALGHVAETLLELGRYNEAAAVYEQAIAINDALQQPNRHLAVSFRVDLGTAYKSQGRLNEAEALLRQTLGMIDSSLPQNVTFGAFNSLGSVLELKGRYRDAKQMFSRALAVYGNTPTRETAAAMQNLGIVLYREGRYADTEALLKRALSIREQVLGPDHKEVAQNLFNLGALMMSVEGRDQEAIPIYKRAISILQSTIGPDSDDMAMALGNLALAYQNLGQFAEAQAMQLQALAMRERVLGPNHPDVALSLTNLGTLYASERRWGDAEKALLRAVAIWEKATGPDNPGVAIPLNNLGRVYLDQRKFGEAEDAFKRALAIRQTTLGPSHPDVAGTLDSLAQVTAVRGQTADALDYSRKATALLLSDAVTAVSAGQTQIGGATLVGQHSYIFWRNVGILARAADKRIVPEADAAREAFEVAQWAGQSSAAAAVRQMGVRFAAGNDALAALVRESQDLSAAWSDKDKALTAARSRPTALQNRAEIEQLERAISELRMRLASVAARLQQQFPDYAALSNPKPLTLDAARKLLGGDEALVYFVIEPKANLNYVFALTKENVALQMLPGADAISALVAAFRKGLDVDMIEEQNILDAVGKKRELFDLALANKAYATLLGPVDALIKGKRHLLVVPSGPLTALPFHLLVTEKPAALPDFNNLARYRDAAWLIRRQAVSVLPSVASLQVLRLLGHDDRGAKAIIGFGDPVFNPAAAAAAEQQRGVRKVAAHRLSTRSYTDFWQGAGVDRRQLGQSLPQLPETADELNAVAQNLGAPLADIHLGRDATESAVKRARLADYRIVYFATHGLVAGDIKGLAEPSLALTIPAQPSDLDDGLLTASEVAKLKLNADWVVLSACNTIAGDKPGAEALSGLARAFFYAGAHALLVSHWSVASDEATRLMTATFDFLKTHPTLGRAEAMRRAMLAFVDDTSKPYNAYPAMWGAFSIIGEGAAR